MKHCFLLLILLALPAVCVRAQEPPAPDVAARLLELDRQNRELSVHVRNVVADRQVVSDRLKAVTRDNERLRQKETLRRKELAALKKSEAVLRRRVRELTREKKDCSLSVLPAARPVPGAALKRENADLHYNLGVALQEQKRYDEAAKEFLLALRGNPADKDAHFNLAVLYDRAGNDRRLALSHYYEYLRLAPDAADAVRVRERLSVLELEQKVWGQPYAAGLDDHERLGRP